MNDRELLSETIQRIDSAVSDIRDVAGGTTIEDVAANVKKIRAVNTVQEMQAIDNPEEGDKCIVYNTNRSDIIDWVPVDDGVTFTESPILIFPKEVTLTPIEMQSISDASPDGLTWLIDYAECVEIGTADHNFIRITDNSDTLNATIALGTPTSTLEVTYSCEGGSSTFIRNDFTLRILDGNDFVNVDIIESLDSIIFPYSFTISPEDSAVQSANNLLNKFIKTVSLSPWVANTVSNAIIIPENHIVTGSPLPNQLYTIRDEFNKDIGGISLDSTKIEIHNLTGHLEYEYDNGTYSLTDTSYYGPATQILEGAATIKPDASYGTYAISSVVKTCARNLPRLYVYSDTSWVRVGSDSNWYQC